MKDRDVARYWNNNATAWMEHIHEYGNPIRDLFNTPAFNEFIGDFPGKQVLDVGCGEGRNARFLAGRGARVTGMDISGGLITFARQQEGKEPLGIDYVEASVSDLSVFDDNSFDAVVSVMVLMDVAELDTGSREIYRVLKPGGRYAFSVRHPCFITRDFRIVKNESGDARLLVGQYFDHQPRLERIFSTRTDKPMVVPKFPYTLSDYINYTVNAGFRIEQVLEPRPSVESCERHSPLRFWRKHAANFLYLRALKPG